MKLKKKFVHRAGAVVETEGDKYDDKPVHRPVAFLCVNFLPDKGGSVIHATPFLVTFVACSVHLGGILKAILFRSVDFYFKSDEMHLRILRFNLISTNRN